MNKKLCKVGMVEGGCGRHISGHRLWPDLGEKKGWCPRRNCYWKL